MFSVPAAQRLNQSTTVEAEVSRLTKESSMQGLGVQHPTKEDLKKKAAATKVRLSLTTSDILPLCPLSGLFPSLTSLSDDTLLHNCTAEYQSQIFMCVCHERERAEVVLI